MAVWQHLHPVAGCPHRAGCQAVGSEPAHQLATALASQEREALLFNCVDSVAGFAERDHDDNFMIAPCPLLRQPLGLVEQQIRKVLKYRPGLVLADLEAGRECLAIAMWDVRHSCPQAQQGSLHVVGHDNLLDMAERLDERVVDAGSGEAQPYDVARRNDYDAEQQRMCRRDE